MSKSISTNEAGQSNDSMRATLLKVQSAIVDQVLTTGGLVIGSSANTAVKIATTVYALVDGILVKKTTAEIVIAGTVANAAFNVFVLSINSAGTVTVTMGTAGATIGAIVFPAVPANSAVIGFVIINPTGTGDFVAGTTPLGDATVVPNAVYVDTVGTFNQNSISL